MDVALPTTKKMFMTFSISKRSFWISNLVLLLVSVLYYSSCKQATDESYSFFVAGHTYGSPAGDNIGLHPPFLDEFDKLNNDTRLAFGIFTGDIVRKASQVAWDTIDRQLERLDMKVYFCAGNHDTYQRELYEGRYGNTFYSFKHNKDLFIILDGSLNRWNIEGKQLEFLHNTLVEAAPSVNNVFVFIHQLVWWDENNVFSSVKLNWPPYTPDTTNYWSTVEP